MKLRTAQKVQSAEELVDIKLSAKITRFIAEYLKDNNATAAAARAGYSDPNYGRQLITNPNVAQAIAQQQKACIVRALGSADEVLAQMWQLATFDANQLSQYRRGACRYCWGFGHHYQWRDAVEFEEALAKNEGKEGAKQPEDPGGYGYDHNREPHPECPRCNGDGIGQPYFADNQKTGSYSVPLPPGCKLTYFQIMNDDQWGTGRRKITISGGNVTVSAASDTDYSAGTEPAAAAYLIFQIEKA